MNAKISFLILSMVLLFPFAHAQATNLQPLWDAINNLGASIQALQQDMQTVQSVGLQVVQDVQSRLISLESQVEQIQLIGAQVILDINANMISLQQRDENLQAQINTLSPNSPIPIARNKIYEVVNFDFNTNSALCNDVDDILLSGYCANGFFGEITTENEILLENFNDGDYAINPQWNLLNGMFVVANPIGEDPALINNAGNAGGELSTPILFSANIFSMETKVTPLSSAQFFIGVTDSPGPLVGINGSGYMIGYLPIYGASPAIVLYRIDSGGFTALDTLTNIPYVIGQERSIKAERDISGQWIISVDGISYLTGVIDMNHTSFTHAHLRYVGPEASYFDDLRFTMGQQGQFQSAFVNINDYNSPMGIRCLNNGSARVMCLQQP